MSSFVIEGGYRLSGEIVPQGAKNEALEVICATLLTPEKVTIHNVPDILDVNNLIQLLRDMRVKVEHPSADTYTFQADDVDMEYLSTEEFLRKSGSLRGSVMIVGPLVARFGRALIPKPGGDKIGRRRLDTHFVGIQKLGACFSYDAGRQVYAGARCRSPFPPASSFARPAPAYRESEGYSGPWSHPQSGCRRYSRAPSQRVW